MNAIHLIAIATEHRVVSGPTNYNPYNNPDVNDIYSYVLVTHTLKFAK